MKNTRVNKLLSPLFFLFSFLLATFVIVAQRTSPEVEREFLIHEPAPRTVFSPSYITFVDELETERLRQEKEAQVLRFYALDPKVKKLVREQVEEAIDTFAKAQEEQGNPLSLEGQGEIRKALTGLLDRFLKEGILEDSKKGELMASGKSRIRVFDPETKVETERDVKEAMSLSEAKEKAPSLLGKEGLKGRRLQAAAAEIFAGVIRPNLFFDEAQTRERVKQARDSVVPVTEEVKREEMVVQKGLLVTERQQQRLIQVQRKMATQQIQSRLFAASIFVFLGLGLTFLYLKQFEPKQFQSPKFLSLVLSALLITLVIEKATLLIPGASPHLLPGALAAILLTVLWKPLLGVLGAFSVSILSAPLADFQPEPILVILLGSFVGILAAQRVRKRIHFLKVGLAVGAVNAMVLTAYLSFQDWRFSEVLTLSSLGLANGFLVTVISFFLIAYFFEPLFGLATDTTLLELSDLNHPLLKRMVVEAPGTYHHSLVVSSLAETACEAIGANALLARVGCYFHDIGKIARSEYFTENQTSRPETGTKD